MIKFYSLLLLLFINTNSLSHTTTNEIFLIGDTPITIEIIQSDKSGALFFHPHEDEKTAYEQTKKIIHQYGGKLVSIKQHGKRLLEITHQGNLYRVDPNRIFSKQGIKDSLTKYGKFNADVAKSVQDFADRVSSLVIAKLVIAVHNNYDKNYNISSYKNSDEVKCYYQNPKQGTGEFFYTTDERFFNFAKVAGYNVVLQSNKIKNDGSFSVYAALQGVQYVNLEVKRGDDSLEVEMLAFLSRYFANQYQDLPKHSWSALKTGDTIDLIAPSSATNPENVAQTIKALEKFGFKVSVQYARSQPTKLYYDNSDEYRTNAFIAAMNNPNSKAVWAIKGGAGATRLLPKLLKYPAPKIAKPLIGFSDITALHNFVNHQWRMPSLHAIVAGYNREVDRKIDSHINIEESLKTVVDILKSDHNKTLIYQDLTPINKLAMQVKNINSSLSGGNLTLVQSSLDTPFQANLENNILIIEDIGNSAHQLERILDNLRYSQLLNGVEAVILGEFIQTSADKKVVTDMINLVLQRFADGVNVPVFKGVFFGHSRLNHPMPLNTEAKIVKEGGSFSLKVKIK
ncbi:MAG: LD-carboxypeptidase [Gammaproteobacteria bacterium]|uniref:Muramoyltetrapeptide carboxypeptidase n=1 Tax=hydrothermal vent metagenome TaxID=652676 RepID=A0A1W1E330_9ZZZZ|nr:LD-carboxypeptidase [Gammaproteobacteria bacterium]